MKQRFFFVTKFQPLLFEMQQEWQKPWQQRRQWESTCDQVLKERNILHQQKFREDYRHWQQSRANCRDLTDEERIQSAETCLPRATYEDVKHAQEMMVLEHIHKKKLDGFQRSVALIGICGRSGAGKTLLARNLFKELPTMLVEPLQTDWFRKRDAHSSAVAHGPGAQDLDAYYDTVIEVCYTLLTRKSGRLHSIPVLTPAFSWQPLKAKVDATLRNTPVLLCLEGFVLFSSSKLVDLCSDLIYLDVDVDTACHRRLHRQLGNCSVDVANNFKKYYRDIVAPEHDVWSEDLQDNTAFA